MLQPVFFATNAGELSETILPDLVLHKLRGGNPEAFYMLGVSNRTVAVKAEQYNN